MTFEIVIPDGAVGRQDEGCGFVRHMRAIAFGNDLAKRNAVVERPRLDREPAIAADKCERRGIEMIGGRRMNAAPGIGFIRATCRDCGEGRFAREINAVHGELERRRFNHGPVVKFDGKAETILS